MPRTYLQLKTDALVLTDHEGSADVGSVAEIALLEALKFVAQNVRLDSLVGEASYTLDATDITNQYIPLNTDGFEVADITEPLELWVGQTATSDGERYEYKRYLDWRRLKNTQSGRSPLFGSYTNPSMASRTFTLNTSDNILIYPFPTEGKICTLFYQKEIAAYSDAGYPELNDPWDSILINGAVLYIKEFLKETMEPLNPYLLFQQLIPQIEELKISLDSPRTSPRLRIHSSYSPRLS